MAYIGSSLWPASFWSTRGQVVAGPIPTSWRRLRALARTLRHPHRSRVTLGGELLRARVVLVANNAYELALFDLGARSSLTGGALHVYSADGLLPRTWDERAGEAFALEAPHGR